LETDKINLEYNSLIKLISELREILSDEKKIYQIIKDELLEVKKRYGNKRLTSIEDF
jgi:DNA gyrase subunit A